MLGEPNQTKPNHSFVSDVIFDFRELTLLGGLFVLTAAVHCDSATTSKPHSRTGEKLAAHTKEDCRIQGKE